VVVVGLNKPPDADDYHSARRKVVVFISLGQVVFFLTRATWSTYIRFQNRSGARE
jgi:hypothetical protein